MSAPSRPAPAPNNEPPPPSPTDQRLTPIAYIYIVRHGETHENRAGIIQGQLDTLLNEQGVRQAEMLGEAMKGVALNGAWSSDLKRARDTAEIVLKHHPGVQLVVDGGLRERYMGSVQGTNYRHDKSRPMPADCESSEAFTDRALQWWHDTVIHELNAAIAAYTAEHFPSDPHPPTAAHPSKLASPLPIPAHLLVVSHGAYISTLVRALGQVGLLEIAPGFRITGCWNTSVSVVEVYAEIGVGRLVRWADISHLVEPGKEGEARGRRKNDKTTEEEEEEKVDVVRVVHDEQAGVQEKERGRERLVEGVAVAA